MASSGQSTDVDHLESTSLRTYAASNPQSNLSRQRLSAYQEQPSSEDSSAYRVSYQSTDGNTIVAQHSERIETRLVGFQCQYTGNSS
ncbi:hypothetical protein CLIM01_14049 [Colletotrichum limetticola]|uniref:Uncharacterized protein n=1 Tax=Colletotrichum limetticola TaxID=1209924 RepID=A0ABQ9P907_9PEZI|nr:hypothetical protein CLIM01_14049 [Colletotrichum limetticola]